MAVVMGINLWLWMVVAVGISEFPPWWGLRLIGPKIV